MSDTQRAQRTDTAAALRRAGLRDTIHPLDAMAFIYPDRECFEASAQRDRDEHHNEVHGPFETGDGLLGIVDVRPQLRELGIMVTPSTMPDDFTPKPPPRPKPRITLWIPPP